VPKGSQSPNPDRAADTGGGMPLVFERRGSPLLPWAKFRWRLVRFGVYALLLLLVSLGVGTLGFWYFAEQSAIDALLNSAMLLGGMGPVGDIRSTAGKLFATVFALYAGLAFLGVAAILFAPIFHRVLHTFHVETDERRPHRKE
jgi:hypothetical protein